MEIKSTESVYSITEIPNFCIFPCVLIFHASNFTNIIVYLYDNSIVNNFLNFHEKLFQNNCFRFLGFVSLFHSQSICDEALRQIC